MAFRVKVFDSVPTTNGIIKEAIDAGQPEGLVACAFKQTAGYGRQGRPWVSPYGGMYASFLLRPQVASPDLPTIALVAALAVRDAVLAALGAQDVAAGSEVLVKWPNDVVCARGKLAGISTEALHGALCIGVGINVFEPYETSVVGGKNTPAYLASFLKGRTSARVGAPDGLNSAQRAFIESLCAALAAAFEQRYAAWLQGGFASCVSDYRSCMAMLGSSVQVVTRSGSPLAQGTVRGINEQGALLVEDAAGAVAPVSSGEAHILSIGH